MPALTFAGAADRGKDKSEFSAKQDSQERMNVAMIIGEGRNARKNSGAAVRRFLGDGERQIPPG